MDARLTSAGVLVVLLGVLGAVGCVPAEKYNESVALNNRMSAQLEECTKAREQLAADLAGAQQELGLLGPQLSAKDQLIASLRGSNQNLQTQLDDLRARLADMGQNPAPPKFGGILLPQELHEALVALQRQYPELFSYDAQRGMLKFQSDVLFARGRDDVSPAAIEVLRKFAEVLKGVQGADFHVYIAGHTDDMQIVRPETKNLHPTNWYLSVHRAVSVQEELTKAGLPPARIGVMGFSEYHPVVANAANRRGAAENRRVELWIVPPDRFLTAPGVLTAAAPAANDIVPK